MDFSVRGAGIVDGRPFGVLLSTGKLGGGGLSRGSLIWWCSSEEAIYAA